MNTPFGRLLEKERFGQLFFLLILTGVVLGALINGQAVGLLLHRPWPAVGVAVVYGILGLMVVFQDKIAERRVSRSLDMALGFSSCFFIYDILILLLWKAAAALLPISQ